MCSLVKGFLACLLVAVAGDSCLAQAVQPRNREFRTWTAGDGRTAELAYVGMHNGVVQFSLRDGSRSSAAVDSLSAEDQQWVTARAVPRPEFRTWACRDGRTAELAFLGVVDKQVKLMRRTGTVGSVKMAELSGVDCRWVESQLRLQVQSVPASPGSSTAQTSKPKKLEFRIWTARDGRTAELAYLGMKNGAVQFTSRNGTRPSTMIDNLSAEDQRWVTARAVPRPEFRTWTSSDGRSAELAFLGMVNHEAKLMRPTGTVASVKLAKLSGTDCRWVESQLQLPRRPMVGSPAARPGGNRPWDAAVRLASYQEAPAGDATPTPAGQPADQEVPLTTENLRGALKRYLTMREAELAPTGKLEPGDNQWMDRWVNGLNYNSTTRAITWCVPVGDNIAQATAQPNLEKRLKTEVMQLLNVPKGQFERLRFDVTTAHAAIHPPDVLLTTEILRNHLRALLAAQPDTLAPVASVNGEDISKWIERLAGGLSYAAESETVSWSARVAADGKERAEQLRPRLVALLRDDLLRQTLKVPPSQLQRIKTNVAISGVITTAMLRQAVQVVLARDPSLFSFLDQKPGWETRLIDGIAYFPETNTIIWNAIARAGEVTAGQKLEEVANNQVLALFYVAPEQPPLVHASVRQGDLPSACGPVSPMPPCCAPIGPMTTAFPYGGMR
jgi:hypothetical protein